MTSRRPPEQRQLENICFAGGDRGKRSPDSRALRTPRFCTYIVPEALRCLFTCIVIIEGRWIITYRQTCPGKAREMSGYARDAFQLLRRIPRLWFYWFYLNRASFIVKAIHLFHGDLCNSLYRIPNLILAFRQCRLENLHKLPHLAIRIVKRHR